MCRHEWVGSRLYSAGFPRLASITMLPATARGYSRNTWHRLPIASKMHVLSTGTYCFVTILIISWATIPPAAAETL